MGERTSVGVVAETKDGEGRVALDPAGVELVSRAGHGVLVQSGAGRVAGFDDAAFVDAGATVVAAAEEAWAADVVVKVKEPQPHERVHLRQGLALLCFLHLAAEQEVAAALARSGVRAFALETVVEDGRLPLLAPMSEIAGRAAAIVAAHHLGSQCGGSGTLLAGAPGVPPARAAVIGLGVAGEVAAFGLAGLGAEVVGVDVDLERLGRARRDGIVGATLVSSPRAVGELVPEVDVVVGAALVPGATAPTVVTRDHVAGMRDGSVVVDLAIDQGGCVATSRPTSLSAPTFVQEGVVHYAVTNMPGQYPRTATRALSAALAPRVVALADDVDRAARDEEPRLAGAINVDGGEVVHPMVAAAIGWSRRDG